MNLRQRYKSRGTRRLIRFLGFYSILAFFLLFYSTFARYATIVQNEPSIELANWQILLNNEDILNNTSLINTIKLTPFTHTTTDNKLIPGQSGQFEIIINPSGTDVSIEYDVKFIIDNLPQGIKLTTYEIVEDSITSNVVDNQIIGEIILQQQQQLNSSNIKTIKVNWEWEEGNYSIPTGQEEYKIQATVSLKQKIS